MFALLVGTALTSCGQTTARRAWACAAVMSRFGRARTRSQKFPMPSRLA